MSMGLDSPMEAALAINYLSQLHGGVAANINYVWAWIAFLTAAVSFWKIKLSSSSVVVRSSLHQHLNSPTCTLSSSSSSSSTEKELSTTSLTTSSTSNSKSSSSSRYTTFCSMENRRSGKFSMYYYNNDNNNNNNDSNDDEDDNTSNLNDTDTTKSKLADRRLRNGCLTRHYPHEEEEEEELLVTGNSINYFQQQEEEEGGLEWEAVLLKMKKTTEMVWYNYQDLSLLNGNVVRLWN